MTEESSNTNETKNEPMTISAPASGGVTLDPQNPLPEPSFFWRRWIAILICANALVFAWFAAAWLVGGEQWSHLYGLTKLLIYFAGLVLTYYFVAPSASELTNMIQSASIIKRSLGLADTTAKNAPGAPEPGPGAQFAPPRPATSQIPAAPSRPAPTGAEEIDAAPRSRT